MAKSEVIKEKIKINRFFEIGENTSNIFKIKNP